MRAHGALLALTLLALLAAVTAMPADDVRRRRHNTVTKTRYVTRAATKTPTKTVTTTVTQTVVCSGQRYVLGGGHQRDVAETTAAPLTNGVKTPAIFHDSLYYKHAAMRAQAYTVDKTRTVYTTSYASTKTVHAVAVTTVCSARGTTAPTTTSKATKTKSSSVRVTSASTGKSTTTTKPVSKASTSSSVASSTSTSSSSSVLPATATGYRGATGRSVPDQAGVHNKKRALHYNSTLSTPPVTYNETLAQYALAYGLKCLSTHSGGPYGENLAWQTGQIDSSTESKLFGYWYDESTGYDYSTNVFSSKTGHFTQLVWRNTNQIGCALVQCPGTADGQLWGSNTPYVSLTCEYSPFGNYNGEFVDNVLPPGK